MNAKGVRRYKRQIVLFVAAILVPSAVLVSLSIYSLSLGLELAFQRKKDLHGSAVEQAQRDFMANLAALKEREIDRVLQKQPLDRQSRGIVFSAALVGERAVMPWEVAAPETPVVASLQTGAEVEQRTGNLTAALSAYKAAEEVASRPSEKAEARLAQARTLRALRRPDEAIAIYRGLLYDGSGAMDAGGVRYRFYAVDQMLEAKLQSAEVETFLSGQLEGDGWISLPELFTVRKWTESIPPHARQRFEERVAEWEEAAVLAANVARGHVQVGARWMTYERQSPATVTGDRNPVGLAVVTSQPRIPPGQQQASEWGRQESRYWLVTVAPKQGAQPPILIAVSPADVAPPGMTFVSAAVGDALSEFPFLYVRLANEPHKRILDGLPNIWLGGLGLVLGIAALGGYLLLRDVNRDVHLAEVRSQFVASVSHELKTPLTAIRMFAETLAMGRAPNAETRAEYLDTIVNESERLARLVDNVLDFSKIEQGKKIYRLRTVRLEDVAESAVRAMQFPLAQQGFQLHVTSEEVPELQADPDAIQQAVLNLLTNAMKYSGDSRTIDLRLTRRNGEAVIEVEDRGLGLTEEEQAHVFEKFYRAPSHASLLIAGTGLGLTLVAHIADAHRGRVAVHSKPGEGSTFSLIIPIEAVA